MTIYVEPLDTCNIAYAVGLAKELHGLGTFGSDGPPFDWHHCLSMMLEVTHNPQAYFALARDSSGYVGAVTGKVMPHYFSPKVMGIEDAWYVREGTRNRAAVGMKLMRGFVEWCLDHGALSVQSGDIASIQSVGVDALYRRMGFKRLGVIYKFERKP